MIKNAIKANKINKIIVGSISSQNFLFVKSLISIFVFIVFPEKLVSKSHKSFSESFSGSITIFLGIFSIQLSITFPLKVAIALFQSIKTSLYIQEL